MEAPVYTSTPRKRRAIPLDNITSAFENQSPIKLVPPKKPKRNPVDWTKCVICTNKSYKKDRSTHCISNQESATELCEDAKNLDRWDIVTRISGEDLVAKKAVYHLGCRSKMRRKKSPQCDEENLQYDSVFEEFVKDINIENEKFYYLKDLSQRYNALLPEGYPPYRSVNLERKLNQHFGDKIKITPQYGRGKSSIVTNSWSTSGDLIKSISNLSIEDKIRTFEAEDESGLGESYEKDIDITSVTQDEYGILHKAVGIVRNAIDLLPKLTHYPTPDEVTPMETEKLIPALLSTLVTWLTDKASFDEGRHVTNRLESHVNSICNSIIYKSKGLTPFTVGITAKIHHEFGSRQLIDLLSDFGLCMTYDMHRQFLTAVAIDEQDKIENGTYIPSSIIPIQAGGSVVVEGADNVDINCQTINGKGTFHSMAGVIFQRQTPEERALVRSSRRRVPINKTTRTLPDTPQTQKFAILPFNKPKQRPEPPALDITPINIRFLEKDSPINASTRDLTWVLLRNINRNENQQIPFWTGYNHSLSEHRTYSTAIGYVPNIDSKPSDMSTVYTSMVRAKERALALGQDISMQTMDQQLYAVAKQIQWLHPDIFKDHIVHLGTFHTQAAYISCIGKLWGDAGLRDLLVDSEVYASNTADHMLQGKQYKRGLRGLLLVFEALLRASLTQFFLTSTSTLIAELKEEISNIYSAIQGSDDDDMRAIAIESLEKSVEKITPEFECFRREGREASPTFAIWDMLLEALTIFVDIVRSERVGNWDENINAQYQMLPYFFSADKQNYSRWLPLYLLEMTELSEEMKRKCRIAYTYVETPGRFNGVATDMGVEKTVIRDSKSDSGIIGFTRKHQAVLRWTITRQIVGEYATNSSQRPQNPEDPNRPHHEAHASEISRDEIDSSAIYKHLTEIMTNPFDIQQHPASLINISTGLHATQEIQKSMLSMKQKGEDQLRAFVSRDTSIFASIKRTNILSFSESNKQAAMQCGKATKKMNVCPEMVFRRAMKLSESRTEVSMEKLLSHPIGSVPVSLFHEDGMFRKTAKRDLGCMLEKEASTFRELPKPDENLKTVFIRDAMSVVNTFNDNNTTSFIAMANMYSQSSQQSAKLFDASTIIDVADRYDVVHSPKSMERFRRCGEGSRSYQVADQLQVPPWKKFINSNSNKASLLRYLHKHIETTVKVNSDQQLKLSGGQVEPNKAVLVTNDGATLEADCDHEEADTRIIYQLIEYNDSLEDGEIARGIIQSHDTDVLVLAIHYFSRLENIKELWIQTGVQTSIQDLRRFIPVHEIATTISPSLTRILPAVHALSGCDSTSSFYGKGKKTIYNVSKASLNKLADLHTMVDCDIDEAVNIARKFVILLYDKSAKGEDLNKLRVNLSSKARSLSSLPPCEDSFTQHVRRVRWQLGAWMRCGNKSHCLMTDPSEFGWSPGTHFMEPVMYTGQQAIEFLDNLFCNCSSNKKCTSVETKCTCRLNNLDCIEMCTCWGHGSCFNSSNMYNCNLDDVEVI